ncbi:UDP-glucose 4-epimerase [archaeon]|nr:UDP-glucose 4-epimerase [archaeon]
MKILVTGGCGFIGSHIVDLLIENGHEVVVLDNLSTGNKENLNEKAKFYEKDIRMNLSKIFEEEKFDVVIHEAAQINVRSSMENPINDAEINILGSLNLIELSKKFNVKKFIYASSGGAMYGDPEKIPCDEEHKINPLSPYGFSKGAVEWYIVNSGLKFCVLRYSNVYGPRQDPKGEAGVISIFIDNMLEGKKCFINGNGEQTRDFVYVEDVAKANLIALEKEGYFNIGTGEEISVNNLFEGIKKVVGKGEKENRDEIKGEVSRISLDVSKAERELGWKAEVKIEDGLRRTVEYFKK